MGESAGISVYDLMPAKAADAPQPKSKGISIHDLAKPVAPQPSGFSRLVDQAGNISMPKADEIAPALNRGLAWINEKLSETEYGRSVQSAFSSAAELQASGRAHVAHAQGPLAPVEGMGGVAEMTLGALATLFAPLTALTAEAAVKPAQAVTKKVAGEIEKRVPESSRPGFERGEQAVEGLEDFALQTASQFALGGGAAKPGVPGRPVALSAAERQAFLARKVDLRTKFDGLAATDPFAAGALADHIGQVDPMLAKYMKRRVQKFIDASDQELSIIGKNAADAAIRELEGDYDKVRPQASGTSVGEGMASPGKGKKAGPAAPLVPAEDRTGLSTGEGMKSPKKGGPSGPAAPLIPEPKVETLTGEQIASTIRTAAKEGLEALTKPEPGRVDMSKPKEVRAIEREGVAARRDREDPNTIKPTRPKSFDVAEDEERAAQLRQEYAKVRARMEKSGELEKLNEAQIQDRINKGMEVFRPEPKLKPGGPNEPGDPDDIIYFNMGVPVTRAQVDAAFRWVGERVPGLEIATGKMARLYEGVIETFNPEAKGPAARIAGSSIAQNYFREAEAQNRIWVEGEKRRTYWLKMGDKPSMDFIDKAEKGVRLPDPTQENARQLYKKWTARIVEQDIKTYASSGLELPYSPLENYIPHLFEDMEGVIRHFESKYKNRWADPKFIKDRSFDLYAEARKAGFTPKFTNPEDIMQARQFQSDLAGLRTDLLQDMAKKGVARIAAKGEDRPPSGFSPNVRRTPTGVRYWVKSEMDPLMHNAFDSKSLWNLQGSKAAQGVSAGFRGWMAMKNALIPFKLAWSAFHPVHVTHIDAAAELTRAQELALANPTAKNITDLAVKLVTGTPTSPVGAAGILYRAWWDNPKTGYPLLRVFQGKRPFDSLSDAEKAAYRDLTESGMVPTRPQEETNGTIQKFKDAVTQRSLTVPFRLPNLALAAVGHPIYNLWIPSLKIASVLKDTKAWREMNPKTTDVERQLAFRQIGRRAESRYGEMNYKSMFMNKMIKDILVGTNLSLGWNLGFLDQYGGAVVDLGKVAATGKLAVNEGRLSRPLFVANYVTTGLAIGGLMTYWLAGRPPSSFLDYTNPDSGEKDQYGKPIRLNTPFYTHEFAALDKHIQQEGLGAGLSKFVISKGSGLYEMGRAAVTGVNTLGQDIRDSDGPLYKKLEQTMAYELSEINSISLKAINLQPGANAGKMRALSVTGFSPAGHYISESKLEGQIADQYNRFNRPQETPFQVAAMRKDTKELRSMYAANDPKYDDKLEAAAKKYDLDDKDIHKMEKQFASPKEEDFDPSIWMFSKLEWPVKKSLLDKMTPEERENYVPHLSKRDQARWYRTQE